MVVYNDLKLLAVELINVENATEKKLRKAKKLNARNYRQESKHHVS